MAKTTLSWKEPKNASSQQATPRTVSWENPKIARREMQTAYERYALGIDLFPKVKFENLDGEEQIAQLPSKTRPAVRVLAKAWDRINEDEAWWTDTLRIMANEVSNKLRAGTLEGPMCSIVRVGLNVVRLGVLSPPDQGDARPTFMHGQYRASEFADHFEGHEFHLTDGKTLRVEDGHIVGDTPDLGVVRGSNTSLVYSPGTAAELVGATS